jgi:hypothetical protein
VIEIAQRTKKRGDAFRTGGRHHALSVVQ